MSHLTSRALLNHLGEEKKRPDKGTLLHGEKLHRSRHSRFLRFWNATKIALFVLCGRTGWWYLKFTGAVLFPPGLLPTKVIEGTWPQQWLIAFWLLICLGSLTSRRPEWPRLNSSVISQYYNVYTLQSYTTVTDSWIFYHQVTYFSIITLTGADPTTKTLN